MRDISDAPAFNIADEASKRQLMRLAIRSLETHPDNAFVLLHVVAAFIDGLAAGSPGKTREAFLSYMGTHFANLCQAIGAEVFYSQVRCKAVHEFALSPPFALSHSSGLADRTAITEQVIRHGTQWTLLNLERVVEEFTRHLDLLDAACASGSQPNSPLKKA
jgi:hypothetical protein